MSAKATKGLKKHFDEPPPGGPPRDLWDGLQKCISNNLRGNLQRFCVTPDYKKILCLLYTSPSPRDKRQSRMPSSA